MGPSRPATHARHHLTVPHPQPGADDDLRMPPDATALFVLYGPVVLDLDWLSDDVPIVLVHNGGTEGPPAIDRQRRPVTDCFPATNVGFGAGVNIGLTEVQTGRVVLCNPDLTPRPEHWDFLARGPAHEVRTVPIDDRDGRATSVVNRYPTPLSHLLTGWRVGRVLRRGSWLRTTLSRLTGWTADHEALRATPEGIHPLADTWVSGALVSIDTARLRQVGGFDDEFFLYFEDVDLCRRLARTFPDAVLNVAPLDPAVHAVGGSATGHEARRQVELIRLSSAIVYAEGESGLGWRWATQLLRVRRRWLRR